MKREGRENKDFAAVAFIFAKGKFAKVIPIKKKNATVAKLPTFMESVIPNLKSKISNITWGLSRCWGEKCDRQIP